MVVDAAVVDQSRAALLYKRMLAVIGCEQNHTNSHFFPDLGECRYCFTGEVLILIGTGLFRLIP